MFISLKARVFSQTSKELFICLMLIIKLNSSKNEIFILFPVYVIQVLRKWLVLQIHKAARVPVTSIMSHNPYAAK